MIHEEYLKSGRLVNEDITVIVLDRHNLGDGRVTRHLNYVSNHFHTVRLNFSPQNTTFGEITLGNNIDCYCYRVSRTKTLKYKTPKQLCIFAGYFPSVLKRYLKKSLSECKGTIILHIHDPILFALTLHIKIWLERCGKCVKVVYDRHEFYEKYQKIHWYPYPTNHTFEMLFKNVIDGIVGISEKSLDDIAQLFPSAKITYVPNYPDYENVCDNSITLSKIKDVSEGSVLRCVYFGTLTLASRETDLILYLADNLLEKYPFVEFIMGGQTDDAILLESFTSLSTKYSDRFRYMGYIPYSQLIEETQKADIGFLFHRETGTYWVSDASPNKFYEYLNCGVIPVVRTPNTDILRPEGVICESGDSWDEILVKVQSIIESPRDDMKRRMESLLEKSVKYRFSSVAPNYLELYQKIFDSKRISEDF